MNIQLVRPDQLSVEQLQAWTTIVETNPILDSPYFRPEFTLAVAAERPDVEVAVLEDVGEIRGFFPFQRYLKRFGRPVGEPLSDYHGLIVPADFSCDPRWLVRACGLAAWSFDHLLADQFVFQPYHAAVTPSLFIDLSAGLVAYAEERRQHGSKQFRQIGRHERLATKEIGPVRFEFETTNEDIFNALLCWKAKQYTRTNETNIIAYEWVVNVLRRIWKQQAVGFSGVLSGLYFGDRLAAVEFDMRAHHVLHQWFPAYDIELARYAPGSICALKTLECASEHGIRRIDLGLGGEEHKRRWTQKSINVAQGTVTSGCVVQAVHDTYKRMQSIKQYPVLGAPARAVARATRSLRRSLLYRS